MAFCSVCVRAFQRSEPGRAGLGPVIDKQHVLHINSPLNVVVQHNADEWLRPDVTVAADFMNEKEFQCSGTPVPAGLHGESNIRLWQELKFNTVRRKAESVTSGAPYSSSVKI